MAQYGLPTSDVGIGGDWVEGAGDGDGDHFDELDEGFGPGRGSGSGPDDATTYWIDEDPGGADFAQTGLSNLTDPASSSDHILRCRNCKNTSGGSQIDVNINVREGGGLGLNRAFKDFVNIDEVWTTRVHTLTAGEANAITDYTTLSIRTSFEKVGGGAPRDGFESAHEFECPDAGGAIVTLAGESNGASSVSGGIVGMFVLGGQVSGIATPSGNMVGTFVLAGISHGVATVTGTLSTGATILLQGLSSGIATVAGIIAVQRTLAVLVQGVASVTGAVAVQRTLSALSSGAASVSGDISRLRGLAGTVAGVATVSGNIIGTFVLTGLSSGISTVSGTLSKAGEVAKSFYTGGFAAMNRFFHRGKL